MVFRATTRLRFRLITPVATPMFGLRRCGGAESGVGRLIRGYSHSYFIDLFFHSCLPQLQHDTRRCSHHTQDERPSVLRLACVHHHQRGSLDFPSSGAQSFDPDSPAEDDGGKGAINDADEGAYDVTTLFSSPLFSSSLFLDPARSTAMT